MPFVHVSTNPYSLATGVGIGMKRNLDQSHIGILYERAPGNINMCHLGWHYVFQNRKVNSSYYWMDCSCFDDPDESMFVRSRLAAVNENTRIAYGFATDPHCFDSDFNLPLKPVGWGLTCASFVLAVFEVLGFQLLDYNTWVIRDDDEAWQKEIIFKIVHLDETQAQAMQLYIGSFRFRPEEVAAGAVSHVNEMPIQFLSAVDKARDILSQICKSDGDEGKKDC